MPMSLNDFCNKLYANRFSEFEIQRKNEIWKILCSDFFQKFIDRNSVVLDMGSGFGEFINNICCKTKFAVDVNKETARYINPEVNFFVCKSSELYFLPDSSVDIVFMSNFSEHLENKQEMLGTFLEIIRILKTGGKVIVLGPNIKFAFKEYWDFFDHHIPLSHEGLAEVLNSLNFKIEKIIPRFLPYTTKSKMPKNWLAVKLYLMFPFVRNIIGKQMLIIARKNI